MCGETKFGINFATRVQRGRVYYKSKCRDCENRYAASRRIRKGTVKPPNDPAIVRVPLEKRCVRCGEIKAAGEFSRLNRTTRLGRPVIYLNSRCKPCESRHGVLKHQKDPAKALARTLRYQKAHPERVAESKRRYRKQDHAQVLDRAWNFKRKSKRASGYNPASGEVKEAIEYTLEQYRIGDKYLDVYSGELIDEPTIDHIVPLHLGGDNSADNMCVTSIGNNSSKHCHSLLIWLVRRSFMPSS